MTSSNAQRFTPLMLSIVTLAYRGKKANDLPKLGTADEQGRVARTGGG